MFSTVNNNGMSKKYRLRWSIIKRSSIVTTHLLVLQRLQTNKRVYNLNVGVILVSMLLLRMARALSNQFSLFRKTELVSTVVPSSYIVSVDTSICNIQGKQNDSNQAFLSLTITFGLKVSGPCKIILCIHSYFCFNFIFVKPHCVPHLLLSPLTLIDSSNFNTQPHAYPCASNPNLSYG